MSPSRRFGGGGGGGPALLKNRRISVVYLNRLEQSLQKLQKWIEKEIGARAFRSLDSLDIAIEQYVQFRWNACRSEPEAMPKILEDVKHALLGAQYRHRGLKGCLVASWESLLTWKGELPCATRTPVREETAIALSIWGLLQAFLLQPQQAAIRIGFAVGIRLMYQCMARPGEFLALR